MSKLPEGKYPSSAAGVRVEKTNASNEPYANVEPREKELLIQLLEAEKRVRELRQIYNEEYPQEVRDMDMSSDNQSYVNTGRINWSPIIEHAIDGYKHTTAFNSEETCLGHLRYQRLGSHMHWVWYQETDVFMSPGCLEEVRMMQKKLFKLSRKCSVCGKPNIYSAKHDAWCKWQCDCKEREKQP